MAESRILDYDKNDEWLDDRGPYIPDIESICLNWGLEETIPDFIYDEMGEKSKHKELKTKSINNLL